MKFFEEKKSEKGEQLTFDRDMQVLQDKLAYINAINEEIKATNSDWANWKPIDELYYWLSDYMNTLLEQLKQQLAAQNKDKLIVFSEIERIFNPDFMDKNLSAIENIIAEQCSYYREAQKAQESQVEKVSLGKRKEMESESSERNPILFDNFIWLNELISEIKKFSQELVEVTENFGEERYRVLQINNFINEYHQIVSDHLQYEFDDQNLSDNFPPYKSLLMLITDIAENNIAKLNLKPALVELYENIQAETGLTEPQNLSQAMGELEILTKMFSNAQKIINGLLGKQCDFFGDPENLDLIENPREALRDFTNDFTQYNWMYIMELLKKIKAEVECILGICTNYQYSVKGWKAFLETMDLEIAEAKRMYDITKEVLALNQTSEEEPLNINEFEQLAQHTTGIHEAVCGILRSLIMQANKEFEFFQNTTLS